MWRTGNECRKCKGTGNVRAAPRIEPPAPPRLVCDQGQLLPGGEG